MDIASLLGEYQIISFYCRECQQAHSRQPPINLLDLDCPTCRNPLDPVQQTTIGPVNHILMFRLISMCYKYVGFSKSLMKWYRVRPEYAQNEEWSIDRRLLLAHAVHAIFLNSHTSLLICVFSAMALMLSIVYSTLFSVFIAIGIIVFL